MQSLVYPIHISTKQLVAQFSLFLDHFYFYESFQMRHIFQIRDRVKIFRNILVEHNLKKIEKIFTNRCKMGCEKMLSCEIANGNCEKNRDFATNTIHFLSAGRHRNITQFNFLEGRNCEISQSLQPILKIC